MTNTLGMRQQSTHESKHLPYGSEGVRGGGLRRFCMPAVYLPTRTRATNIVCFVITGSDEVDCAFAALLVFRGAFCLPRRLAAGGTGGAINDAIQGMTCAILAAREADAGPG